MDRKCTRSCKSKFQKLKHLALYFLFLIVPTNLLLGFEEKVLDELVAEVNRQPIFLSEVRAHTLLLHEQNGPLVSSFPAEENSTEQQKALQDLINLKVIESACKSLNIQITDQDVEDQITKILSSNKANREQLEIFLDQNHKSMAQYKEDLKRQILFNRFRSRVIIPRVRVTSSKTKSSLSETAQVGFEYTLRSFSMAEKDQKDKHIKSQIEGLADYLAQNIPEEEALRKLKIKKTELVIEPELEVLSEELNPNIKELLKKVESGHYSAIYSVKQGGQTIYKFFQVVKKNAKVIESTTPSTDSGNENTDAKAFHDEEMKVLRGWIEDARQRVKITMKA